MKNRVLTFIIGLLVGLIIAVTLCLVYTSNHHDFNRGFQEDENLTPPGEKMPSNQKMSEPFEKRE